MLGLRLPLARAAWVPVVVTRTAAQWQSLPLGPRNTGEHHDAAAPGACPCLPVAGRSVAGLMPRGPHVARRAVARGPADRAA